jgi:transglutaminase-like putative cysteine protease
MKITVAHSTVYQYLQPVQLGPHVIRLRPRDDGAQRLLGYELRVEPQPALMTNSTDHDGNVVAHAWFKEPAPALEISSRFAVETLRENPFDFLLTDTGMGAIPVEYPEPLRSILAPYVVTDADCPAVTAFARSAAEAAAWRTLNFLVELNNQIRRLLRPKARTEGPARTAAEILDAGEGACRDFAMLFCSACRSMRLAARFVSGYEREAARDPGHACMHMWAEVYLPGGGWRGFDPLRGLAVGTSYVPVAAALHPEMTNPISGTYEGATDSTIEKSIRMSVAD